MGLVPNTAREIFLTHQCQKVDKNYTILYILFLIESEIAKE